MHESHLGYKELCASYSQNLRAISDAPERAARALVHLLVKTGKRMAPDSHLLFSGLKNKDYCSLHDAIHPDSVTGWWSAWLNVEVEEFTSSRHAIVRVKFSVWAEENNVQFLIGDSTEPLHVKNLGDVELDKVSDHAIKQINTRLAEAGDIYKEARRIKGIRDECFQVEPNAKLPAENLKQ